MPRGNQGQHQQDNQNQAQHNDGDAVIDQIEQVNQNGPNQPPNNQNQHSNQNQNAVNQGQIQQQQRINYPAQIRQTMIECADLQNSYFQSIDDRLSQIQESLEQLTESINASIAQLTTINASIANLTERINSVFGPDVDGTLSNAHQFINTSLADLDRSKIVPFFVKFIEWINQNTDLEIPPVSHYQQREKKLLLNKIDEHWDQLEPHLRNLQTVNRIKNLILNPT